MKHAMFFANNNNVSPSGYLPLPSPYGGNNSKAFSSLQTNKIVIA